MTAAAIAVPDATIEKRALGIRRAWSTRRKYIHTTETDSIIERAYEDLIRNNDRGATTRAARQLGWPRFVLNRRAQDLGLAKTREPRWTPAEELVVERYAYLTPEVIVRHLRKAGYQRTPTGVKLKLKHLRVKRNVDGCCAHSLAQLLGIDPHAVTRWISKGMLRAVPRETARTVAQGGDSLWVSRENVKRFILAYPDEIDLRKVNKYWFLDVLTNGEVQS